MSTSGTNVVFLVFLVTTIQGYLPCEQAQWVPGERWTRPSCCLLEVCVTSEVFGQFSPDGSSGNGQTHQMAVGINHILNRWPKVCQFSHQGAALSDGVPTEQFYV